VQKQVDASLRLLMTDIQYPSLQVKKIQGTQNIYELTVSLKYRISFEIQEDGYFLRKVGEHDALLRSP
jgi:mRNA interferase RelE/StbE